MLNAELVRNHEKTRKDTKFQPTEYNTRKKQKCLADISLDANEIVLLRVYQMKRIRSSLINFHKKQTINITAYSND